MKFKKLFLSENNTQDSNRIENDHDTELKKEKQQEKSEEIQFNLTRNKYSPNLRRLNNEIQSVK